MLLGNAYLFYIFTKQTLVIRHGIKRKLIVKINNLLRAANVIDVSTVTIVDHIDPL